MSDQSSIHPLKVLRIREYRFLMIGRFFFIMGLRMMGTLVGWWVYELTGNPFAIGLIGLAEVIPAVGLSLYAGHVIDIGEKRKILLTGAGMYFLIAAALLLLSWKGSLYFSGHQTVYIIYAAIFLTGVFRAFTGPSFGAMLGQIVPKELLQQATTWNQGTWLTASVFGHAGAGLLIAFLGNTGTLATLLMSVGIGWICMTGLLPKPPSLQSVESKTWDSVKEGLQFVFKTKEILGALSLDLFAVLFGGAVAMVPVFAKDILKVGPSGFGWLNAAVDIGAILVVVLLTLRPIQKQQGKKLMLAVGGFGLCIILFAISKSFWWSFILLVIAGMLDGISVVIRGTILQLKTPQHMRGRVMSVNSMFINSSNELGQFESGVAARYMGVVPSVIFGGSMTLLVVLVTWLKAPTLKKLEY